MPDRNGLIEAFLAANGLAGARVIPLAGDASFRRYFRLRRGRARAVLMDAPPARENVRPFLNLAEYLRALGYSAPAVLAADVGAGLVLLEDLGDQSYTRILRASPEREGELYAAAVDLLADLHVQEPPAGVAPYDEQAMMDEADLFVDWYIPHRLGRRANGALRRGHAEAWAAVLPLLHELPRALVLRDYHADNLMWMDGRDGLRRVGLLDFQDGLSGPVAYDVVSLLEDARRDVSPATVEAMTQRYIAHAPPGLDEEAFRTGYAVLGAQRNLKILGIFARLFARDGKPGYLALLPRVWAHLERDLAHPALGPVQEWLAEAVPPGAREHAA